MKSIVFIVVVLSGSIVSACDTCVQSFSQVQSFVLPQIQYFSAPQIQYYSVPQAIVVQQVAPVIRQRVVVRNRVRRVRSRFRSRQVFRSRSY